jgi:CRISPR system Cascade subunit CasA
VIRCYSTPIFDLTERPFVPCLTCEGTRVVLSLPEVFSRAPELTTIAGDSPIQTAALWRFLLAILYSCLVLKKREHWADLAFGKLPIQVISSYLAQWRHRFDLFDPERPFFQTPGIEKYFVPIQKLFPERAAGNNDTLFDHTHEDSGYSVDPAAAARGLITAQAFAVGGLVSFEKKEDRSAQGGALASAMVVLVSGATVFEILLRNLSRYDPSAEEPFPVRNGDLPAWQRSEIVQPQNRFPDGLRDFLTFQSRRLLLRPYQTPCGEIRCDAVAILKGEQFHPDWSHRYRDPYVAFRRFEKATNLRDQWLPIGLEPERGVWRDSASLFAPQDTPKSNKGSSTLRPYHFEWLARLRGRPGFDVQQFELMAFGQATDQATVLLWREDRLTLPLVFLSELAYSLELGRALELAEASSRLLRQAIQQTMKALGMSTIKGIPHLRQAQTLHWSRLEPGFRSFLLALAKVSSDESGDFHNQEKPVLEEWEQAVRTSARTAFVNFGEGLSANARTLAALSTAERFLESRLRSQKKSYLKQEVINA